MNGRRDIARVYAGRLSFLAGSAMAALFVAACGVAAEDCPVWPELIMVDVNGSREVFIPSWDPCKESSPGRCQGPDGELTYTATVARATVGWDLSATFTGGGCTESIQTTLVEY